MRMYDIIHQKKNGLPLTEAEIRFLVKGYTDGSIPDYQMSAFLMAVCFRGMTAEETAALTMAMAQSGDMVDLSAIQGVKADKHSTGGVGDKTTLVVGPVVAACGVAVAKMSGRGLGHTGGTIDKLESIPGFQVSMSSEEFTRIVNTEGICIAGQSGNLAPADKKIYALRDVTATVDSIPLIAASIMSKKLASGADCIVLDVKTGSGAFMKTLEDSIALAQAMVEIGEHSGRKISALITQMDMPLGYAVGNSLEIKEAIAVLQGHGPNDLREISLALAAEMLLLAGKGDESQCRSLAQDALASGRALQTFRAMVSAQGGNMAYIDNPDLFPEAPMALPVLSPESGYIVGMDAEGIGVASMLLGAGRETSGSGIDYSAGIIMHAKTGDYIQKGSPLATLYTSQTQKAQAAREKYLGAVSIQSEAPAVAPLIYAKITKDEVIRYDR